MHRNGLSPCTFALAFAHWRTLEPSANDSKQDLTNVRYLVADPAIGGWMLPPMAEVMAPMPPSEVATACQLLDFVASGDFHEALQIAQQLSPFGRDALRLAMTLVAEAQARIACNASNSPHFTAPAGAEYPQDSTSTP